MMCYFIGGPWDLTKRVMDPLPHYDVPVLPQFPSVVSPDNMVTRATFEVVRYYPRRVARGVTIYMTEADLRP